VAALKGAMLRRAPAVRHVDVTHHVAPQDVMEAAFVLRQAAPLFPADTVHLVVVDPGVGTERLPIAAAKQLDGERHYFVGPDNGILSLLLSGEEPIEAVVLDRPAAWRVPRPSDTFHGRDVFGPVAAALASGTPLSALGSPLAHTQRLLWPLPRIDEQGIDGMVIHVDAYGNCLTNIPREAFGGPGEGRAVKCYVGPNVLRGIRRTYGSVPPGEPLVLFASNDHLEIAVNSGNASTMLSIARGDSVSLVFSGEGSAPAAHPDASARYV
jgi:S-adenosylmethionine hydrolase